MSSEFHGTSGARPSSRKCGIDSAGSLPRPRSGVRYRVTALAAGPLPPRADEHAASGVLKRRIEWLAAAESPSKTNGQKGMCPLPTSCGSRMIALSAVLLLRQPALDLRDREEPVRHIDLSGPMAV